MKIKLPCASPWHQGLTAPCGVPLEFVIDTVGDPNVNVGPDGLTNVAGPCVHVDVYNYTLEEGGEELFRVRHREMARAIDEHFKRELEEEAEYERRMEAEYNDRFRDEKEDEDDQGTSR
jgi:hypothetical protein